MSETMVRIDAAAELAGWTRRMTGMYCKDLAAIPEQAYATCPGGVCRTPQDITAEVAGFCFMVADRLNGKDHPMPDDAKRQAWTASLDTREKGIRAVQEGGEALAAALTTAGDRLGETVQAPWGEQLSLYQLSQVAANHILYHDGQLNYLQALKGDGDMHWFD